MGALLALVSLFLLQRLQQPIYEGRRVGEWFDDLCSGVFVGHNTNRWKAAFAAFSHMDSNAVPFLVRQLAYDQSGRIEGLRLMAQKVPVLSYLPQHVVAPSERRSYAAVALKQVGTNAVAAFGPLVSAFQRERLREVRVNMVVAMGALIGVPKHDSFSPSEWQKYEEMVLQRAWQRCPELLPIGHAVDANSAR